MTRGRHQQKGFALWALAFMLTLGLGYSLYLAAASSAGQNRREAAVAATLLRAKEALLARAVNDQNRPGSLPCPDLVTDSLAMDNHPGDGKADMLAGNHCPTYLGWLPWLTLDLPELTDDTGNHLWYALSPSLRDDDSAQPINGDTAVSLTVDGQSDIAAIIIAPRAPVGAQQRPSNQAADYLESNNGRNNEYRSRPQGPDFNDSLITLTRAEIMAAVGKRVAGELRSCLEHHADSSADPEHRYPWPAPLGATNARGNAGSRFGRIAATQPSAGPEAALMASRERLNAAQEQLAGNLDAQQQAQSLKFLRDAAWQARQLFDAIYRTSSTLKQSSDDAASLLQAMSANLSTAAANGRISRSEGGAIRALDQNSGPLLDNLPGLLGEFGTDVFPWELARRTASLAKAQTPEELLERVSAMRELLAGTHTSRTDLAPSLAAGILAASQAHNAALAAAKSGDAAMLGAARSAARDLLDSAAALGKAVAASRVNLPAREIADLSDLLDELRTSLIKASRPANPDGLVSALANTRRVVANINTGVGSIAAAREASINAVDTALLNAQSTQPNPAAIDTSLAQAIERTRSLSFAIAANEAADNNVGRTSLQEAIAAYRRAQSQFATIDTATPRPPQSDILPFAETLGAAAAGIDLWVRIISANASVGAPLAKAAPALSDKAIAEASPLDDSAYRAAAAVLDSIDGSGGSAASVQTYLNKPGSENRHKANAAVAASSELTGQLIRQTGKLAENIKGSTASAFPMVWNSPRCDFLNPGQYSWWHDNRWSENLFYQISSPLQAAPGKLTVNAAGKYRLVVLASGPGLPGQHRNIPSVGNFLEGINASPTRNGEAISPSPDFSGAAPGPGFNDRLAY